MFARTAVFVVLVAVPGAAQVNVEPVRKQLAERGWAIRLNGSIAGYVGNTEGITLGASSLTGGRSGRHLAYTSASADYARYNGTETVSKYFVHGRYNLELRPRIWAEVFGQIESDQFRRVRLRELVGVGPRLAAHQSKIFDLYYGISYMPEWTRYEDDSKRFAHRLSQYLAVTWKPDDRALLSSTTYHQPRVDAFADYKLLSVSSLAFAITPLIESKVDVTVRHESRPLAEVETTDLEIKNSIGVVLQ